MFEAAKKNIAETDKQNEKLKTKVTEIKECKIILQRIDINKTSAKTIKSESSDDSSSNKTENHSEDIEA